MRIALALAAVLAAAPPVLAIGETFDIRLKKPRRGIQVRSTPFLVPPGEDLEWCEYRRLPNKKEMLAQGFEQRMSYGAHHFVVWAYNGNETDDSKFPSKPVLVPGCTGIGPGDSLLPVNLFGMQVPNGRTKFPRGIAVRLKARQQVWINPHVKNFGTKDVRPVVAFNLTPAPKGSVKHLAESFAIGSMAGINIPARGRETLISEWAAPQPLNLIMVSTHQHALGIYAAVEVEQADGSFLEVFETDDWEHPGEMWTHQTAPWKDRDPQVIRLETGQRIRWTCRWENPTDARVTFGTETTNEMCFATGYYYRDADAAPGPIAGVGCFPTKEGLTCPAVPPLSVTFE
jgi:hypothetical protein